MVTYLCRFNLSEFTVRFIDEDGGWNFAKRLITANFSRSWTSTLKSGIVVPFSSLQE
jgi:hypothetical protein